MISVRSLLGSFFAFALMFSLLASHSLAQVTDDAGGASGIISEDNDNDGALNNVIDDGDNIQPSGQDRSVESGASGNQGNAQTDPDDNGTGPDRSNGGQDQPDGPGGVDLEDQDGNNGCGNDDDFEDDNEGNCGGGPRGGALVPPVTTPETTPVTTPVSTPVTTPVTIPETTPVSTPVTTPVTIPETVPVTTPGMTLETLPARTSGTTSMDQVRVAADDPIESNPSVSVSSFASAPDVNITSLPVAGSGPSTAADTSVTTLGAAAVSAVLFFTGTAVLRRSQGI